MVSQYRLQARRLDLMHRYSALVTNSQHMVRELKRHGLNSECVYPFVGGHANATVARPRFTDDPLRLIFSGRMSPLKGGDCLLSAAPEAQRLLGRKLHVTFAGDGPRRAEWQSVAVKIQNARLTFDFPGWLSSPDLKNAIAGSHLLVLPSVWPEPFGLSGLEAGLLGVPAVAFAIGGVPEWLNDGVNGHLAPVPPSPAALAEAIVKALANEGHFEQLRSGACQEARRYRLDDHIARLIGIFERCAA
jgi:glycosyltransferase involved in cell wall biosynthesis